MRTPLEETIKAIDSLVSNGTVLYWGTSNWTPTQIMEAIKVCEKYKYVKPICEQSNYSMIKRGEMEKLRNLFKKYGYGTTTFSPLYSGVLSGKYLKDIPIDSRYIKNKDATAVLKIYFDNKNKYDDKLNKLSEICKQLNCTLAQLAIAWVIVDPDVSTCILGATKLVQLEENIKALNVYKQLNKNILLEIEKILDNTPKGEMEWKEFKELPARRNINLNVDYIKGVTDVDTKKKKKPKKEEGEEGEGEEQQEEQQ
jgi:aryl-alcohol dehydrogenase-like predicted oxidoreductase